MRPSCSGGPGPIPGMMDEGPPSARPQNAPAHTQATGTTSGPCLCTRQGLCPPQGQERPLGAAWRQAAGLLSHALGKPHGARLKFPEAEGSPTSVPVAGPESQSHPT